MEKLQPEHLQTKKTALLNVLKRFQAKTALVVPDNFEIEFLEASSDGAAYRMALDLMNMYIGRALLCPDLLGFTGQASSSGGSQALGVEQLEVFSRHIARRRRTLEKMIDIHLVKPLVKWNFGDVENYPKFKFNPITQDDAQQNANLFLQAVKDKVYAPNEEEIEHFREIINFPKGEVQIPEPAEPAPIPAAEEPAKTEEPKSEPIEESDIEGEEEENTEEEQAKQFLTRWRGTKPSLFYAQNKNAINYIGFL